VTKRRMTSQTLSYYPSGHFRHPSHYALTLHVGDTPHASCKPKSPGEHPSSSFEHPFLLCVRPRVVAQMITRAVVPRAQGSLDNHWGLTFLCLLRVLNSSFNSDSLKSDDVSHPHVSTQLATCGWENFLQ